MDGPQEVVSGTWHYDLQLFPNPATESVNLHFNGETDGAVQLAVIDALGRIVLQRPIRVSAGMNDLGLDLSTWEDGLYVVRLTGQAAESHQRLLIAR